MEKLMRYPGWLKAFGKDRSGVAAVEFALIAPFFVIAILGVVDVGLMAFDKMKLTSGVRSASQYVLVGGEDVDVMKSLVASGSGFDEEDLTFGPMTVHCSCAVDDAAAECFSNCSDDDTPRIYRTITVTAVSSRIYKTSTLTSEVEVRTR